MITCLITELFKLRRSLVLLIACAAPALVALFVLLNLLRSVHPPATAQALQGATALWAIFMLPLAGTALAVLMAQLEHTTSGWEHLLALPVPRWKIFLSKASVLLLLVWSMSACLYLLCTGALIAVAAIRPDVKPLQIAELTQPALLLLRVTAASTCLQIIELWVALRFRSFIPALALGIGGTFLAVAASGAEAGVYIPWQMPIAQLATVAWRAEIALLLGSLGGVCILGLMLVDLCRKDID